MPFKVVGIDEFNKEYDELKASASDGDSGNSELLKKLAKAVTKLKQNYRAGKHVPKDRIPEYYAVRYGVTNLWKLDLDKNYRLIYTLRGTSVEIMCVLLEFFDHKKYSKRFGYKK